MPADEVLGLLSGFVLQAQSIVCQEGLSQAGWVGAGGEACFSKGGAPKAGEPRAAPSLTNQCSSGSVAVLGETGMGSLILA